MLQLGTQPEHAGGRLANALLAVVDLLITVVRTGGRLPAGTGHFVGGGDHFVERGADQFHRFALATGDFVHVASHLLGIGGGHLQIGRRGTDALHQLSDHPHELVEPARQRRRFILALDLELTRQVAFALGDLLQTVGDATDRTHDDTGEAGANQGEHDGQHCRDGRDQPGQVRSLGHHFFALDQADEPPAQPGRADDVGHVDLAVDLDLSRAIAMPGQLGVVAAQVGKRFEVVFGIAGIHQHVAIGFDQHQIAAVAQLDVLHQFGHLLERHIQADHADHLACGVGDTAHRADQRHIVRCPIVGVGAHRGSRSGHRSLVPGSLARVVIGDLGVIGPAGVTTVAQAQRQVSRARMGLGEAIEDVQQAPIALGQRHLRCVRARVVLQIPGSDDTRVLGDVLDVLADAVEELFDAIVDLPDLTAAAVDEVGPGRFAQVEDDEHGHHDDREAGDDRKAPGEFLLDVHGLFRWCCKCWSAEKDKTCSVSSRNILLSVF